MRGLQPWESAHDSVTYRPDIGIAAALQGLGIAYPVSYTHLTLPTTPYV